MPLAPLAAVMAPKAGAAMATALAIGGDDFSHHAHDLANHAHDHATAFIHLPISKQRLVNMIVGPEIAAYNWAHAKISGVWDTMFGTPAVAPDQGRMVEYYASGCGHCKHLEPIWKDAVGMWQKEGGVDTNHVVWQQKQCLDENWKPGADFQECQAQHVSSFPTIRFFAPGSKTGEDFFLERSPQQLVDFAKTGIAPSPGIMPRAAGDVSDMKLVDFYAEACPHCKHLEPVWDDAHKQWDKAIGQSEEAPREDLPLISFEKKECYDNHWKPGKDHSECEKFHVHGFPSIKLFVPDPHGHGFAGVDYTGPRTSAGIVDFLKHATGMPTEPSQASGTVHAAHQQPAAVVAHEPGPIGVKVPDEIRALAEGANVPQAVKAAASASHEQAVGKEDLIALQGNTPLSESKAAMAATREDPSRAKLPEALAQAVKTAIMPLPVLSCIPAQHSPRRASLKAPPAARAQFI